MNYKLHYAPIDLGQEDIPCYEFATSKERVKFIEDIIYKKSEEVVFVLCFEDYIQDCVYVGDSVMTFEPLWRISDEDISSYPENAYLQEYESYEEAYKVALDMKETNPFCYNK
jgi:hypothetical protein